MHDSRILTQEEQIALARMIALGGPQGDDAQKEMILRNLPLVHSIARKFRFHGLPLEDLLQEGSIGLIEAVRRYEPDRPNTFATYATYQIRHAIQQGLERYRMIRLPALHPSIRHRQRRAVASFIQAHGREPTLEEVAESIGSTPKQVRIVNLVPKVGPRLSAFHFPEDIIGWPLVPPPEQRRIAHEEASGMLQGMDERQKTIIKMHFGLDGYPPMTLKQIGEKLGICREWVRRLEIRGLKWIRSERT